MCLCNIQKSQALFGQVRLLFQSACDRKWNQSLVLIAYFFKAVVTKIANMIYIPLFVIE